MQIRSALRTDRLCKSLTGLTVAEFTNLVSDFSWNYHEYEAKRITERKRKLGGGRGSKIETIEEKLFYVLFYLKTYPTFDMASFYVGFARSKAHKWAHILFPILEQTMKRKLVLPERKISSREEFERLYPEVKEVFADGIERSIQRSKNKKKQNKTYSGKKKQHTRKSVVVSDKRRRILVVTKQGNQAGGMTNDWLIRNQSFEMIPEDIPIFVDTAFIGEQYVHPNLYIPKKKTKKRPLTDDEKEMNKLISSYRVLVEHAIGGVKRYRCMSEKLRNRKIYIDDTFILLSAGLWNYHLQFST